MFVNVNDLGQVFGVQEPASGPIDAKEIVGTNLPGGRTGPLSTTRPNGRFREPVSTMPCNQPPWGELVAVNMDTGDIAYRKTLGVSDMLPAGFQDTGRPSSGGVTLTASGLTFVGGTDDFRFRAFTTATGDKLWEIKMPSSIETSPITYMGSDGRQFVTVVSTGGGLTGSVVTNDEIIAFALPNRASAGVARQ
jgi:quinoprotein glucose dehydrogenase